MSMWARLCSVLLALGLAACTTLDDAKRDRAQAIAMAARSSTLQCTAADACAQPSALRELAQHAATAASTPDTADAITTPAPATADTAAASLRTHASTTPHQVLLLDYGQDALLARINLLRSARQSIDIQTYIFDEDDAGHLILDELLAAARRGVRVRLLIDQLSALRKVETLAALSGAHQNLQLRIYNPVLDRARITYPMYALAAACCWRQLNQRMHSKLFIIDAAVAITGGRNYQDAYYDWNASYNFRDRDILIAGAQVAAMQASFEEFWTAPLSRDAERLTDVGRYLLRHGVPNLQIKPYTNPQRVARISADANDARLIEERLLPQTLTVNNLHFIADSPNKHRQQHSLEEDATASLQQIIANAQRELLLQTPYLVLSPSAQSLFAQLQQRTQPPRVLISTNSLAATDSFITYAMSYKYKRRYLREFGFEIYEYKPFPENAPIDIEATGTVTAATLLSEDNAPENGTPENAPPENNTPADAHNTAHTATSLVNASSAPAVSGQSNIPMQRREYSALRYAGLYANRPVPLQRAGVRMGLHSKSMVIDGQIGVVGTHNFDPRGDNLNTESAVIIHDTAFAQQLRNRIFWDMSPENAWVIAPRQRRYLRDVRHSVDKASESLPLFDVLPIRYATSYQFQPQQPGCSAFMPPYAPDFYRCHVPVGDFPETQSRVSVLLTRIFTAFGSGLAPIL